MTRGLRAGAFALAGCVLVAQAGAAGARDGAPAASSTAAEADPGASGARTAFERFKGLEGRWIGSSTKGWEERITFETIAGGSAVVETSFDAHPSEKMLTVFHMDGDRLVLTHYCVAGNQPRMVATGFEDGGATVTFTFLDGGGLRSRDQGHMDSVVFRFVDRDNAVARWSWYEDGAERWLEEIRLQRLP